jgi:hypothetical protein
MTDEQLLAQVQIALQHAQRLCKWIDGFNLIENSSNLGDVGKKMFQEIKDEARVKINQALKDMTDGS